MLPIDYIPVYRMHGITVPAVWIAEQGWSAGQRLRASIDGKPAFPCGLVSAGDGSFRILLGRRAMEAHGLSLGQAVSLELREDPDPYGYPMPPDLRDLLADNPDLDEAFHALTPGRRRGVMAQIDRLKSPEARIRMALKLLG